MVLEQLSTFSKDVQEDFKKICNILLNNNFLAKDKKDNTKLYYFVVNYKQYFDEFFSFLGATLVINNDLGCIQLKNETALGQIRFNKIETFIILILRILYQEKLINTTLNNTVQIAVDEIHAKYESFGFKRKMFKTDLVSALRLFKKYNIIDNLGDLEMSSTKILIFSSITMLIPVNDIQECYTYVVQLENGKENSDENLN